MNKWIIKGRKDETQANLFPTSVISYLLFSISKRSLNPEVLNVYYSKDQDNKVNGFSNLFQLVMETRCQKTHLFFYCLLFYCYHHHPPFILSLKNSLHFCWYFTLLHNFVTLCSEKLIPKLFQILRWRKMRAPMLCLAQNDMSRYDTLDS